MRELEEVRMDLLLFASDFHYGRRTAGWNSRKAAACLQRITKQASKIAADIRANRIFVLFLGDIVDGESVYPEQAYDLELVGFEQVYEGAELFAEHFIRPLAAIAPVHLDGVPGNHSYLRFAHKKTNLDALFYATLVQFLKEGNVRFTSSFFQRGKNDALEVKMTVCNQVRVLIGHGHFIRTVAEIPFAGAQRRVLSWLSTYAANNMQFQVAAFGHFHRLAFFAVPGNKFVLFNGCMLAHDEFSLTRYGHHGDRVWAALVFEGKNLLSLHLLADQEIQKDSSLRMAAPVKEVSDLRTQKR
jgi:hypothetical protein